MTMAAATIETEAPTTRPVYAFSNSDTEEVRATVVPDVRGQKVDLRVWFRAADGRWLPTRKGVRITSARLPDLRLAVEKLTEAASRVLAASTAELE